MYFNLARQLAHVGLIEQSITAFWRLLRAPRQSAARQQGFVEELCAVLRSRPPADRDGRRRRRSAESLAA